LTFGGICVVSSVSGCAGFLRDVTGAENVKNIIIADYTNLNGNDYADTEKEPQAQKNTFVKPVPLRIGRSMREQIEAKQSEKVAREIIRHLAKSKSEIENMLQTGHRIAKNMSWDVVVKNYLLPSLQKALHKHRSQRIYTKA